MMRGALRTSGLVVGAALVFAFAWLYRFNDPGGAFGFLTDDHFFYLVRGWQILFGELPTRDFVDHGAPLYFYVAAAVQLLFGRGTLSEIAFSDTILAASAAGVFILSARASGSLLLAGMAAAFHILLGPRFYNYPKIAVYVAAIPALWAFADRPDARRAAVVAAITAVAFLFRYDHGAFVAAALVVLVVSLPLLSWRQRVGNVLIYGGCVLALLAPYLVFVELNGGLVGHFSTAAEWAARDRGRAEVVWPGLFDNPDGVSPAAAAGQAPARAAGAIRDNAVAWLYYSELALPLLVLLMLAASPEGFRSSWPNARAKMRVVAALGILLNVGFLRQPLEARLADPSVPHAIMLAWLPVALAGLFRRRERLAPALRRPATAFAARLAAVALVLPFLAVVAVAVTSTFPRRMEVTALAEGPHEALARTRVMWDRISDAFPPANPPPPDSLMMLVFYLRECTRPADRVFMQHYLPQVLGLAERGFAGGHADLRPGFFTTDEMQRLTVHRLRRQSVPVALVGTGDSWGGFRESFPLVTAYFDERYRSAGERTFDERFGIRLLVERDGQAVRRFGPLDWPCFR
jgi:hypothetical protein